MLPWRRRRLTRRRQLGDCCEQPGNSVHPVAVALCSELAAHLGRGRDGSSPSGLFVSREPLDGALRGDVDGCPQLPAVARMRDDRVVGLISTRGEENLARSEVAQGANCQAPSKGERDRVNRVNVAGCRTAPMALGTIRCQSSCCSCAKAIRGMCCSLLGIASVCLHPSAVSVSVMPATESGGLSNEKQAASQTQRFRCSPMQASL